MKKMMSFAIPIISFAIGAAVAADAPDVKEGLWSVHTQTTENPGNKKTEGNYSICRSHAYDQAARAKMRNMKGCTTVSESFQAGKYSSEMRCTVGGSVIESRGIATFDGDTAAHSESHSTNTPAMFGVSETTQIMDQKYVGSCPAGAKPGDRVNADGKVNHSGAIR